MKATLRKLAVGTAVLGLGVVAIAGPAGAGYLATENGTRNCPSGWDVYTTVNADGAHKHTIAHSTSNYQDVGYVRTTAKYSGAQNASWTTSGGYGGGGGGYYNYSASGGFCKS